VKEMEEEEVASQPCIPGGSALSWARGWESAALCWTTRGIGLVGVSEVQPLHVGVGGTAAAVTPLGLTQA